MEDPPQASRRKQRAPGLAYAYFSFSKSGTSNAVFASELAELIFAESKNVDNLAESIVLNRVLGLIASEAQFKDINFIALRDADAALSEILNLSVDRRYIDFARETVEQGFVVQNSPPEVANLLKLLAKHPSVLIGTYVGSSIADGSLPLLLITVPLGIVVVGSAVGISRGLENGLHKSIEKLISKRLR